jgi:hypothetical protein
MRRSALFLGPSLLAALAFACEDDPSGGQGVQFPEAGAPDTNRPAFDGSVPDGADGWDATVEAAAPKDVTVIVANRKGPRANVTVIWHDANGAATGTAKTDGTGRAVAKAPSLPSMATVLLGEGTNAKQLFTWTGIEAGDELVAVDPEEDTFAGYYEVALPGGGLLDAGGGVAATSYEAFTAGCSTYGNVSPLEINVGSSCLRAQNAVLVRGYDINGFAIGHTFQKNVAAPVDGGTVQVNGLGTWAGYNQFTVTAQNPPGVAGVRAGLLEIASGAGIRNQTANVVDGNNQAKFRVAPGFAEGYQASISTEGASYRAVRTLLARVAPSTSSATLDFQNALPELTDSEVDETEIARPIFKWTAAATLAGADGGVVRSGWYDEQSGSFVTWNIVVPPSGATGSVKAPALPAAQSAGWVPVADAGNFYGWITPEIEFAEADSLADYPAFKKSQSVVVAGESSGEQVFLPVPGAARRTLWRAPAS